MVGLVCRFLRLLERLWGRAATLQSVRLLVLLLLRRRLWGRAATLQAVQLLVLLLLHKRRNEAATWAVQLLVLLLQHKRRKQFQHEAATWQLVLLPEHKRRKQFQHGAATWQQTLLLRHRLRRPWVAVARLCRSPTRVPLVPYTMVAACVHQAGGHQGGDGYLMRPAIPFALRSQMAYGLGRRDSKRPQAVRGELLLS